MKRIQTATEAGAWLEGLINFERDPALSNDRLNLEPIRGLLDRVDRPERGLSIIHIAGSKGKGSTSLFAESILRAGGERVGTFTSPHLERWTERFRINGEEVEGGELAKAVETLRPHVEAMRQDLPSRAPTFFDVTTAAALLLFSRLGMDRVILEVGLGGRLDSTNVVQPASTCVTQIELEHTDRLGNTLAAIAGEKAGILKPGVPVVMGRLKPSAAKVVVARAEEVGAPLRRFGKDFKVESLEIGTEAAVDCPKEALQGFRYHDGAGLKASMGLSVLGAHQIDNAVLAMEVVANLPGWSRLAVIEAARSGLMEARLPGRLEILETKPFVLVDSAHTEESARALRRVLDQVRVGQERFVLSMSRDKDVEAVLAQLISGSSEIWLTRADAHRSLDPQSLSLICERVAPGCRVTCEENPRAALAAARNTLGQEGLLCCTGSVYLAGLARGILGRG